MSPFAVLLMLGLAAVAQAPDDARSARPGARLRFTFPDLPNTLAGMVAGETRVPALDASLPSNYTAGRKFPMFVYLKGGSGGPDDAGRLARAIIGDDDFIVASVPLFKKEQPRGPTRPVTADDLPVLRDAYRTMFGKLLAAVPNVDVERSVIGGHSNGAHTLGVLLSAGDDFLLDHFHAFYLHEGGFQALTAEVLGTERARRSRFLLLVGDRTDDGSSAPRRAIPGLLGTIEERARAASADLKIVVMRGYGHDVPPEYMRNVRQFARGEPIEDIVATERALAEALPRPVRTHPDTTRWNDLLVGDLTNMRLAGGSWTYEDGSLSAGSAGIAWTKATHSDFALDLEFKLDPGAGGGILLYNTDPDPRASNSVEIVLAGDGAPPSAAERSGAFLGHRAPSRPADTPPGRWHRLTIVALGPEIDVILNDELVNLIDLRHFRERGPGPDGAAERAGTPWSERPHRGRIGLRASGDPAGIAFRDLKLLHLAGPPRP